MVFADRGWHAGYSFGSDCLVVCPRCDGMAHVRRTADHPRRWRVTCIHCGYSREHCPTTTVFDDGRTDPVRDPGLRLPLWLQTPCRGRRLWAYNWEHLDVLEEYVTARLRVKRCPDCGHHHQRMIHKLPRWLAAAGHRDDVRVAIARLRARTG